MAKHPKTMIGWREWCEMPGLGLPKVMAKIDTGARTSALHAFDIEIIEIDKHAFVRFKIHPVRNREIVKICEAPLLENRTIVSSNGERENRPVIVTELKIGDLSFVTEITLTARHQMNFRMLIGRKAMRAGRLTVDPVKSFLLGRQEGVEALYRSKPRKKAGGRARTGKTKTANAQKYKKSRVK